MAQTFVWNTKTEALEMEWITIDNIAGHEGEVVELRGWIANRRSSGKVRFLMLRDGPGLIQCVVAVDQVSPEVFDLADRIPYESSVIIRGEVKKDARAPIGFEINAKDLILVSEAEPYPIAKKDHGVGFLMDHRHLWIRSSQQTALLKLRSVVSRAARGVFRPARVRVSGSARTDTHRLRGHHFTV